MRNAFVLAIVAMATAACSSNEVKRAEAPATSPPVAVAPTAAAPASATPVTSPAVAANPLKDPTNILSQRSVYFAFDDSTIRAEDQKILQAHGKYLVDHRDLNVRLEGNCDERGSREYNLALGQRRAQAAKGVLQVLGVADSRVETISFGEDKPVATGHDEASWSRNRHADVRYPGE